MAAERGAYIDQSQSLNLFIESPTIGKLSSMYMYAWKRGVKTTYYLRSRPATSIAKTTVKRGPSINQSVDMPVLLANTETVTPMASEIEATKEYSDSEAITCSLENPDACEAGQ